MRINPDGASAPLVCKGPGDALETAGQELGSARAQADRTLSAPFLPSLLSALAAAHPTVLPRSKSDSTGGPRASITLRDLGTLGLDLDLDLDPDPAQNDERESASAACASPRHSPVLARWTEQRRQQAEVEEGRAPPAVRPSRISPNGLMAMSQIGKPATASGRAGADSGPGACTVSITLAPEGVPSTLSVAPMSQGTPPSSNTLAPVPPSSVAGAAAASLPVEALWLAAHTHPAEGCSHGFLVMELCEGGSVALWRGGRWKEPGQVPDMATLLTVALDIAYGMAYLHSQGVCHGDLKLSNVLLARSGSATSATSASPAPDDALAGWSAKLCDFGLSRVLTGERTHVSTRPHGTPTHMAPELWAKGHVSQPADVYAFGITLWELATGQRPYKGLTAANILHRVMLTGGRPVLPLWLPRAYIDLTTACWAQSPKERPGAAEVVRRLEALLTALGTAVAPPSLPSALAVGES
ncbi:hypothetical protein HYH03_003686 [Edaphochlamys debaryana]|uniref:Protein kinase domain-containing protein n=1 Tax=Edaphochlamys debaryana TaxID=47281 RepID=A0A835YBW9_9CHLO|nr:hypothetical protein HYH03_003686 [Edaphochlamys debaryana]|eukprot:KAG2498428.1 hypothetical protein HYH03_003686 [Edaphochlamys debaryana]